MIVGAFSGDDGALTEGGVGMPGVVVIGIT
jgi:hypothetical protein